MRLHRLQLRDVRGVRERTVEFPDTGVVVIEGPNEVGKTTLLEALDLLLDPRAKATSRSRAVKALQPLNRDVGPRVEAEFTVGAHRVRFTKQWLRGPSTELEILAPTREQHTGEAAQHRLDALLADALDRPLWDALRFTQAGALGQVPLTDSAVLTQALDGASGMDLHTADGGPLLERVEQEFGRYYTRTGRMRGELKAAAVATEAAREAAVHAHQALLESQGLVQRHEQLRTQVDTLSARTLTLRAALQRAEGHQHEVETLVRAHEESTAALDQARRESVRAREDLIRRERALQAVSDAESRLAQAEQAAAHDVETLARQQQTRQELSQGRDAARAAWERASAVAELALADVQHLEEMDQQAHLATTLERLAGLREQQQAAQDDLAATPTVDRAQVQALEAAEHAVVQAEARLEASTARVSLEALGEDLTVAVNDEPIQVSEQTPHEIPIHGGLRVELPGQLRVTVRPQDSAAQVVRDLQAAEGKRAELLDEIGVNDLNQAREAAQRHRDAAARVRHTAERIEDLLAGGTEDQLLREQRRLTDSIAEGRAARPRDHHLPVDTATARAVARAAAAEQKETETAWRRAETAWQEQERQVSQLELQIEKSRGVRETLTERLDRDRQQLAESQQRTSGEALQEAVQAAESHYARVESRVAVTGRELEEADPEGVRARLTAAEQALTEHESQVTAVRRELAQVQGKVELVSGEGRQEAYDLAVTEFLGLKGELERVHHQARAVRHLRETLMRHRQAAHRAYVQPYRREVQRLGQQVYGPTFDVEVAPDLTITSRTLAGLSVPFDQLSGGAREQLGILSRLAVAGLVESGAGVPVVIDDALGYTDPDRLDRVSAVLAGPGQHTQVVLLTCTPQRYQGIPGATTIQLSA